MLSWTEVEVRQMEHEHRSYEIEQNYWMRSELKPVSIDRWQWRIMNAVGSWLVAAGCRLQTHVETARQMVHPPQAALDGSSQSARPCP
jgi:hypothetical protein